MPARGARDLWPSLGTWTHAGQPPANEAACESMARAPNTGLLPVVISLCVHQGRFCPFATAHFDRPRVTIHWFSALQHFPIGPKRCRYGKRMLIDSCLVFSGNLKYYLLLIIAKEGGHIKIPHDEDIQ
ncbi:uncharacterized protein [Triticum aestivum]|uniref:uncharacterized protein isoform X1 n=1 Tax=Triticum aestivum TaxID=4565 RepID=UPI001D0238F1|nr:uncharacterized protein LOC123091996 isoform X1 [Triticum aestivum]